VSDTARPSRIPATARRAALATAGLLAACVVAAAWPGAWPSGLVLTALLLVPVLLPLPGLIAGRRRTCAWATLCVTPYFVYGLTELIANPAVRLPAAAILFASLAWFVALVACLRLSRPAPAQGGDAA
jgi:uncharacterized membrane protein